MSDLIITTPKQDFITFNGVTIDFTVPVYQMSPETFEAHREYLDTELRRVAETSHPLPVSRETMESLTALHQAAEETLKAAEETLKQAKVNLDRAGMVYGVAKPKPAERRNGESLLDFKVRREEEAQNPPPDFEHIPLVFREAMDTATTAHEAARQEALARENTLKSAKAENRAAKVAGATVAMQWLLETHPEVLDQLWIRLDRNLTVWQELHIPYIKADQFSIAYYYRTEDFHKGHVESAWEGSQSDEIPHASLVAYGFVKPEPPATEATSGTQDTKSIVDPKVMVITHYGMTLVLTPNQPGKSMEIRISVHGYEGEGGTYIPDKVINFELYQGHLETMYRAIGAALELEKGTQEVSDIPF